MSLAACLGLTKIDRTYARKITDRAKKLQREGKSEIEAARMAAQEHLDEIEGDLADIREQLGVEDERVVGRLEIPQDTQGTPEGESSGEKPQWHRSQDEAQSLAAEDKPIEIATVPSGTVKDAIRELHTEIKKHQGKEYINADSGISVLVNGVGIDHAEGTATFSAEIAAMTRLGELIENSVASKPEETTKNHVASAMKMFVPVKIGEQKMVVKITALEHRSDGKHRFYDLGSVEIVENKKPQPDYGPGRDAKALPRPTSVGGDENIAKNQPEGNGQDSGPLYSPNHTPGEEPLLAKLRPPPSGNRSIQVLIDYAKKTLPDIRLGLQKDEQAATTKEEKDRIRANREELSAIDLDILEKHMLDFPNYYLDAQRTNQHPANVFLARFEKPPQEPRLDVDGVKPGTEWKAPDLRLAMEELRKDLWAGMDRPPVMTVSKGLPETAAGSFTGSNAALRTRYHNDLDTMAHEVAHAVDLELKLVKRAETDKELASELLRAAQHGTPESARERRLAEGVAEALRAWMVNPSGALERSPTLARILETEANPKVVAALKKYGDTIRSYVGSSALGKIAGAQTTTTEALKEEKAKNGTWGTMVEAVRSLWGSAERKPRRGNDGKIPSDWGQGRARILGGKWNAFKEKFGFLMHDSDVPLINNFELAVALGGDDAGKLKPWQSMRLFLDFLRGSGGRIREMMTTYGLAGYDMKTATFSDGRTMTVPEMLRPLIEVAGEKQGEFARLIDMAHAYGTAERTGEVANRFEGKAQAKIDSLIEKAQDDLKQSADPVKRKRAEEKLAGEIATIRRELKETLARLTGAGGGIESATVVAKRAQTEFDALPEAEKTAINHYLRNYREWANWNLQYRVDSGLLSAKQAENIRMANQKYMDWHRIFASLDSRIDGAVEGSTRSMHNPLVSLLLATEKTVASADRNRLMHMVTEPLLQAQKVDRGIAMAELGQQISETDAKEAFEKHSGTYEFQERAAKVYRLKRVKVELDEEGRPQENVVTENWVFDAGTEASMEAMRQTASDHPWVAMMNAVNSLQRATIVLSPAFRVRTLLRDNWERMLVSESGTSAEGLRSVKDNELFGKNLDMVYHLSGGSLAGMTGRTRPEILRSVLGEALKAEEGKGHWMTPAGWAEAWGKTGEWTEGVARKIEFATAAHALRKEHPDWSEQDVLLAAMSRSRNLLDTAKKGLWIGKLNGMTLFLNASIKALETNTRIIRKMIAAKRAGDDTTAAKYAGVLSIRLGTTMAMLAMIRLIVLSMNDEEKQKKLMGEPGWIRDFSIRLDVPGLPKISIAKPYEMGWLCSGAERLADAAWAKGQGWDDESTRQMKELANPKDGWLHGLFSVVPLTDPEQIGGAMLPMIEVMSNHSLFRGGPIVSPYEKGLDVERRKGTEHASILGQGLQFLSLDNIDSRNIDHLINAYVGGFGRMATATDFSDFMRRTTGVVGGKETVSGSRDIEWVTNKLERIGKGQGKEVRGLRNLIKAAREAKTDEARIKAEQAALRMAAALRKSIETNPKRWGVDFVEPEK